MCPAAFLASGTVHIKGENPFASCATRVSERAPLAAERLLMLGKPLVLLLLLLLLLRLCLSFALEDYILKFDGERPRVLRHESAAAAGATL